MNKHIPHNNTIRLNYEDKIAKDKNILEAIEKSTLQIFNYHFQNKNS